MSSLQQLDYLSEHSHRPISFRLCLGHTVGIALRFLELSRTPWTVDVGSPCFLAGPASEEGLRLRSFRIPGGLEATTKLPAKYQAFPGIINGGIISTLFDCHGNWTAAIALMDRACLPRPPLTLTYELLVLSYLCNTSYLKLGEFSFSVAALA